MLLKLLAVADIMRHFVVKCAFLGVLNTEPKAH